MKEAMCSIVFKTDKFMNLVCDHQLKTVLEGDSEVRDVISIDTPNELVNIEMKLIKSFMVTTLYSGDSRDTAVTMIYKNNTRYTIFIPSDVAVKLSSMWKEDHTGDYIKVVGEHSVLIIRIKDVIMVQFHKMRGDNNIEKPEPKPVVIKQPIKRKALKVIIKPTHQLNDSIPPTPLEKRAKRGSDIDSRLFAAASSMKVVK